MSKNIYERLSEERKELQRQGLVPEWYSTAAFQMFKEKYEYQVNGRSVRGQFERIAKTAAKYLKGTMWESEAEDRFFNLLWNGWLSPSTPVLANMGTTRGLPVSCSGSVVEDSIHGFYSNRLETAILTKHGFGTSSYLGNIRGRGSNISVGGKASGVLPVYKGHVQDMRDVAQGTARRGAWAGYIEIDHKDFDEIADFIHAEPDDANIGWIIKDEFVKRLDEGDQESIRRFQKSMKVKMVTGKGYFLFIDKVNAKRPLSYVNHGLEVKASNLCSEITLFADKDHTFTCVLSSMIVTRFDEWKDKDAVYWATIFLDCVAEDLIQRAKYIKGLEKAVRFTEKGRALGLGQCGFHTLLQERMIPFESLQARLLSQEIAKHIWEESERASKEMAEVLGEPQWCKGTGLRNTHRIAVAPTKSCVVGETKFKLVDGSTISFDDVIANNNLTIEYGGEVFDINPIQVETPQGYRVVDKLYYNGVQPVLEMVFGNGNDQYTIKCTFNHSFLDTKGRWITAENVNTVDHEFQSGYRLLWSKVVEPQPTFDIHVPVEECYILESGIVSHNTAVLVGGISEGINPDPAMVFTQKTAAGDMDRINPTLLGIMKERGVYTKKHIREITDKFGSVQHVDWLTPEEKEVFKTAFEINQKTVVALAAARGKYIDQWQSLNLFFGAEERPEWIAEVHAEAFRNPNILGLYYVYTQAGLGAAKDTGECVACQ